MNTTLFTLCCLLLAPFASFANEKIFHCSVDSFSYENGWSYSASKHEFRGEIQDGHGKHATASGTIELENNFEVVLDVRWNAETAADDVNYKPDPRIALQSRLQRRISQGDIRIIDWASTVLARPGRGAAVTRSIFVSNDLKDMTKLSSFVQSNPDMGSLSNHALSRNFESISGTIYYIVNCRTGLN